MAQSSSTLARVALVALLTTCASLSLGAQAAQSPPRTSPNAIVGRVVDKAGRPVADVFVSLLHTTVGWNGETRVGVVDARAGATTQADGSYLIEFVPIGAYYVVALPHNPPLTAEKRVNRSGYGITYYPAAARVDQAREVLVTVSGPVTADITLVPASLSAVSGIVVGQTNQPLDGKPLGITHGDHMFGIDSRAVRLRADGSFLIAGLPPGTYYLQFHEGAWPPPRDTEPVVSVAKIAVAGQDLAGVRVTPVHRVRGTGRVIISPVDRALFQRSPVEIGASPGSFDGNPGPQRPGMLADDLTFAFEVWPGMNYIRVFPESFQWTFTVRYRGVDVTKTGIDFKPGQETSGIEISIVRAGGK